MRTAHRHGPALRLAPLALLVWACGPVAAQPLDSAMDRDPEIRVARPVKTYPNGLAELWVTALDRPDQETRSRAALAIAAAHEGGMPGLATAAAPALVRMLNQPDTPVAVSAGVLRAVVALDIREAAPAVFRLAREGDPGLRDAVELALARWDYKSARDLWLARLGQPPPHGHATALAARCLALVRDDRATAKLRELALSTREPPPVRLAAARALGEVRTSGGEPDAAVLVADATARGIPGRLAAASLLRRHGGADAVRLLQSLAQDAEPAVAVVALTRLLELDPKHVVAVQAAALASPDAEARGLAVDALFRTPSDDRVKVLGRALADPHPDVRGRAGRALADLSAKGERGVIEAGESALTGNWRGQEQAAILLARLGHAPAAGRLVGLLKSDRPEVFVAAAWGLQRLAVPDTLPKVLDHVRLRHADILRAGPLAGLRDATPEAVDQQLSFLAQLLGAAKYRPASETLKALVPRFLRPGMPPVFSPVRPETRAAAAWALGLIHEGKPDAAVVDLIAGRMRADGSAGFDDERVRRMAAVSLGRIGGDKSLAVLREFAEGKEPSASPVPNACRWALHRLTAEPIPAAGTIHVLQRDWFLVPTK